MLDLHRSPGELPVAVVGQLTGISSLLVVLGKVHREEAVHGQVQPVQPHHRPITFTAVVMPVPRRGENDISTLHHQLLPLHRGKTARSLDDEPQGKGHVPVSRGGFSWQDELKTGVDGVGGVGCLPGRVYQHEHTTLCLLC
ncbi:hypothetical protein QC763_0025540 [Podospora pseudopauciseta]|uniref:Uncharacterized protein n=1 Tax=Podospora pseudopauciseta TaxID=2093780 RepID=A0ABR0I3R0_9PEZI|nr:hypothetical protein QC763_0025540 [Podospora pseudopauciseta]